MKVVFDSQIFSFQKYGGISRYFSEIKERLSQFQGVNLSVIAPFFINEYLRGKEANVIGHYVPLSSPASCLLVKAINNLVSPYLIARSDPDIVHETYYAKTGFTSNRSKTIITVFDMIHEKLDHYFKPLDKTSEVKRAAIHRSNHIICISENTKRDLINIFNVDPDKVSVTYLASSLPNPPNTERFVDVPYILYVGQRGGYKNFSNLLKAYSSSRRLVSDFKLVCFGGRPFTKEEMAQQTVMKLPADRLVRLTGDDDVLAGLYKHASVFVYPSLYEGFGIPPLEAMGCGCPVACSNTSSLPEVVGDAARLFDPNSIEDIRTAIEEVVYHPENADRLVRAGTERVKMFSWSKCAKETFAIYRRVLSE
ncbi:glycosyltransferase family 1 protein [Candidatus Parcubacteria bacterium]|nr:MAG: glycosyltransferase family 1 protein [Candidatus Parcubacteria bacterium]